MLRLLTPTVIAIVFLPLWFGHADEPAAEKGKKDQGIQAEVRGDLHFESGRGYFISVKPGGEREREMRVSLWISEDKALVRRLQGLEGKEVIAKGKIAQLP